MTAGVTSALCGVAVAVVASIPGDGVNENQRTGRRPDDPESWSTWLALGLTLACLLWLWTLWSTRPSSRTGRGRRARGVASSVLAAACVAALLVVVLRMPSPGPSGGVDLSLPLMLLAFTLAAIGALATAMGSLRRPGAVAVDGTTPRRGLRLAASIAPVAAVPLLTVAVAVGVVPSWVVAVNTEGVTTDRPAPAAAAPALTGAVAWSTPPRGEGPSGSAGGLSVIGTAGGLAVLESRGLRMLDPASGTRRWAFHRWDVRLLGPRHRPNRVDTGSTAVSPDGRLLATTVFVDTPRMSFIDGLRAATRVWVFDTVSGVLRADFAVPETARIVAVGEGCVTIDLRQARDEPGAGALGMLTFGGETAWRFPMDEGCRPTEVVPVGGDVLTIVSCYSDEEHVDPHHRLVRLSGGDGRPLWSRQVTRDGGKPGAQERFEQVSLGVTDGVAVVDAREIQRGAGEEATVTHNLTGIRVADGRPQWWLPDADRTRLRSGEAGERGPLHAAAGRAVFAEEVRTGTGEEARYSTALHAFDVRTGRKSWSHTVPDIEARDLNDAPGPLALLRDGRLFVAYRESTAAGRFKGCAMAAWDITTGQRHGPFQPTAVPREEWCLTSSLEAVEIPGGVAVHLKGGPGAVFVLD
ncbi:PQQ-binding-like beta-propeller repeat protein [Spirillospora sp. NPDC048832]